MNKVNKKLLAAVVGLIFFVALLVTMTDYNIPWDARNHYFKGQAFANFFLKGWKNYQNLPITKEYARHYRDYVSRYYNEPGIEKRISQDPNYRRSIYQDDVHTYEWLIQSDQIEHPVLSDILASFSNILFYEKLGILRDDYAYRLSTLFLASILVAVIFYWALTSYGWFAAFVSTLTLVLTPLFWAESHFSIKDVPEMTFFTLTLWFFWRGITTSSLKKIFLSAICAGFALATKFNIVFLPFIVGPWFLTFYVRRPTKVRQIFARWWWMLIIFPLVMLFILFITWPQLWFKPVENFLALIKGYYIVGVYPDYTPTFRTIFGFSTYALVWIFFTTYPLVGVLASIGIMLAFKNIQRTKDLLPLFLLLWLAVPIIRASLPFTSIFGGVRHIMEYIPALALLTGYGVLRLVKLVPSRWKLMVCFFILLGFIPLIFTMVRLHPAENVYFNSLIGGLAGAKKANLNGWGYNDGGIYRVATKWLNQHAENGAHVAVAFSEPADFFIPELREDLLADNQLSGYLQKGEYIIALTHDTGLEHTYRMRYPENFLEPVYTWVVDGVPLIKIWKNDKAHLKKEIQVLKEQMITPPVQVENGRLSWDLGKVEMLSHIEIEFMESASCQPLNLAYFQISQNSEQWETLPETYPGGPMEILIGKQPKDGKLIVPIAGLSARYISLVIDPETACLVKPKMTKIFFLRE